MTTTTRGPEDGATGTDRPRRRIGVVGTGIAGMGAAWLLSQAHDVTVFERGDYIGGHSNTVDAPGPDGGRIPVDTGFIVYNEQTYPNLVALFQHLGVPTHDSDMSFSASLRDGGLEYAGTGLGGLLARPRNAVSLRFWAMLRDLVRFYRQAPAFLESPWSRHVTLGEYLTTHGYSDAFIEDHLLPMGAAIWSTPTADMRAYPAAAFIQFFQNHGLLKLLDRPIWRTVTGGSREYVHRLTAPFADRIHLNARINRIRRVQGGVVVEDRHGDTHMFDDVVLACHADEALALLADADDRERTVLTGFRYTRNRAILHSDPSLMPRARRAWASWNVIGTTDASDDTPRVCVTYWMNRLQGIASPKPLFVTLNPPREPADGSVIRGFLYDHPVFDDAALAAQDQVWRLQGHRRTWFCGAYMGAGFHEDGLQAGLAVAEALGGVARPWTVPNPNGRIRVGDVLGADPMGTRPGEAAA
ncbi:NAD(P)-binding protein [Roseospira marina]|uniref:NAD(P)-binding protein n=1 Tax=Roseospira marina TaxID=140057 RepID=A0A5M6I9Z6_9PROT|nr:FAD-dependent oxidoreductase [Roseospira marina]KAA5604559.1 NAD(P)-binding protein [Roseospira marina]MBB4315306.1 putative NAD/FAD-binding protein [Roseospira marina]MBB5088305.1 putative NAD/FAD-binding protein [Roseospira marina]